MEIRTKARSRVDRHRRFTMPYSVTMCSTSMRVSVATMHVRHDARNRAILGGRFQPDEGLSTPGEPGSLDEIKLPSRAAVLVPVDEFPVDLAVEIDFDGGIDAHQIVVLRDHVRS